MKKKNVEKESVSQYEKFIKSNKKMSKYASAKRSVEGFPYKQKVSTGSFNFDQTMGGGIFSAGMVKCAAPRETGKTAFALAFGKNWQDTIPNGKVVYIDAEARMQTAPEKIKMSGIDTSPEKFEYIVNNNYEFVAGLVDFYSDEVGATKEGEDGNRYLFIIDSLDALLRSEDETKGYDESLRVGGAATVAAHMMKKTYIDIANNGHFIWLLSQHRDKLPGGSSGNNDGSGGNAMSHWSSLIMKFRKIYQSSILQEGLPATYTEGAKRVGHILTIDLLKTPNETTGESIQIPIKKGYGVWREYEAFMAGEMWNIFEKSASWISFEKPFMDFLEKRNLLEGFELVEKDKLNKDKSFLTLKFQGKANFIEWLESNPKITEAFFDYIKEYSS